MKTLKRIFGIILTASLLLTAFTACTNDSGTEKTGESNTSETITVIDHLGHEVVVPKDIDRIVIGKIYPLASVVSIFFDSAEKIVGMPIQCMTAAKNSLLSELYPEILNAETNYIDGANLNIESLLLLEPDVMLYNAADDATMGQMLRDAGIPAVAVSVNKWHYDAIETLENWIDLLSQLFPENSKAQLVSDYSKEVYDRIRERVDGLSDEEKKDVFFLYQYTENMIATSGNHFFGQWWADAVNAHNVGEEIEKDNSVTVNMEQIYKWNPECILITNFTTATPDSLYSNAVGNNDWSNVGAVKDKNVHKMPLGMYRSYTCGVDTPVTLLWVAKTVYPELFEDIDITSETKSYYKEVFGIELSDKQAESIFAPAANASAYQ